MADVPSNFDELVKGNATDKVLNAGCNTFSYTIFNIKEKRSLLRFDTMPSNMTLNSFIVCSCLYLLLILKCSEKFRLSV